MASFTGVGDNVELLVPKRGTVIDIDLSGTYDMQIDLQREIGAPGSGAFETIRTVSTTANATIADNYTTKAINETIRLIVIVDTSGTAVSTLTDNDDRTVLSFKDVDGTTLVTYRESGVEFAGSVRGQPPVNVTAAAITLTAAEHAGRPVTLNRAAGVTVTLPAATGTGDVYFVYTGTTVTSNGNVIQAASSADVLKGGVAIATDIAGVVLNTAATTDTITQNGTTTGGVLGSWVRLTDIASGVFTLEGFLISTGAEATPFSAAV